MAKYNLRNRSVVITGASSGIGKELSRAFAKEGSHIIICAHPGEKNILEAWAKELRLTFGVSVQTVVSDLSTRNGCDIVYDEVMRFCDTVDVLVNNAGIIAYGPFHQVEPKVHEDLMMVNARAYMVLMRRFIPHMIERGQGRVLNVCSVSAFQPSPHHAIYGATKAFVQSMSEAVNRELVTTGVRIMTLNPSYTDTPLLRGGDFPSRLLWYRLNGLQSPARVADRAVWAFKKGKTLYIPGIRNAILHLFFQRFLPRRVTAWMADVVLRAS